MATAPSGGSVSFTEGRNQNNFVFRESAVALSMPFIREAWKLVNSQGPDAPYVSTLESPTTFGGMFLLMGVSQDLEKVLVIQVIPRNRATKEIQ